LKYNQEKNYPANNPKSKTITGNSNDYSSSKLNKCEHNQIQIILEGETIKEKS